MKKAFFEIIVFVSILSLAVCLGLVVPASAEADVEEGAEIAQNGVATTEEETPDKHNEPPTETLWTRLSQAWENGNVMDVAVIAWGIVCTVLMFVMKNADKIASVKLSADVKKNAEATTDKMNEVVAAQNAVEESAKAVREHLDKMSPELFERLESIRLYDDANIKSLSAKIDACGNAVVSFAQMMQTIYSNSRTLPQPTKDVVNANYVSVINAFKEAQNEKE